MIRRPNTRGKNRNQAGPAASVAVASLRVVSVTLAGPTAVDVELSLPFALNANPGDDPARPWTFTKAGSPDVPVAAAAAAGPTTLRLTPESAVTVTPLLEIPEWSPAVRGYMRGHVLPGSFPLVAPA